MPYRKAARGLAVPLVQQQLGSTVNGAAVPLAVSASYAPFPYATLQALRAICPKIFSEVSFCTWSARRSMLHSDAAAAVVL